MTNYVVDFLLNPTRLGTKEYRQSLHEVLNIDPTYVETLSREGRSLQVKCRPEQFIMLLVALASRNRTPDITGIKLSIDVERDAPKPAVEVYDARNERLCID